MLKKRDLQDAHILFPLLNDRAVKPYVREKADSLEAYYFLMNRLAQQEDNGELISRTIMDDWGSPIGAITLYDIENRSGFLATWLGKSFFGKGYNQYAKEQFLYELFVEHDIDLVFLKVNQLNARSIAAMNKIPYAVIANDTFPHVYEKLNQGNKRYKLFAIHKEAYLLFMNEREQLIADELEA
ncbi:GNAT family N-acetyltransferase [Allobacillus sp. SKP2-8]|uniref:GNAT family N-acetyltransferase n=1 Tax=unclassified Allobacillus TaxID=2628859 RepID=UPI0011834894|nr:GNAT family protein [Allobacillus sp. SKP2-8]TSJ66946.1 GNAT family N-acetyltransferase [Allobacillus sp. SKP2-8]